MIQRYVPTEAAIGWAFIANEHFDNASAIDQDINTIDGFDTSGLPSIIHQAIKQQRELLETAYTTAKNEFAFACQIANCHFHDRPVKWQVQTS